MRAGALNKRLARLLKHDLPDLAFIRSVRTTYCLRFVGVSFISRSFIFQLPYYIDGDVKLTQTIAVNI